jgi:aminoglycoside/choline kinase family phosphotransferase
MNAMSREQQMMNWLQQTLGMSVDSLLPASSDASFRRYFRLQHNAETFIVMDAPPDKEDCSPYIKVSAMLDKLGLHVPRVLETDRQQGFLLLTDLGSQLYLDALSGNTVDGLYGDALRALGVMQTCRPEQCGDLPPYDETLLRQEMALFTDWLLDQHLQWRLNNKQREMLQTIFDTLVVSALQQPRVFVHRDYHSRNLMVCEGHNPGILDFQDAVIGPLTYDLVSLLRDCYIAWPDTRVEEWALGYRERVLHTGILREDNERAFLRSFDLMGMQRHFKASGIFARLYHRDNKAGYLKDVPRTLAYISQVSQRYPEFHDLARLLEDVQQALSNMEDKRE